MLNGPAPKRPEDRARNNRPPTPDLLLPAEGWQGEIPEWPLPGKRSVADLELWAELWRTPQAAAWARLGRGCQRVVARYARMCRTAAGNTYMAAEVRQIEDRLGLTPLSMRRLGWDVVQPDIVGVAEPRQREREDRWRGLSAAGTD